MKNDRKTKNELIEELESIRRKVKKLETLLKKRKHAEQNITERTRVEEELGASEVRYRRLFEAAKDGILILDAETGMIVDVNPFLIEMLGYPYEQFIGKRIWELGFLKDIIANKDHFLELQKKEYIRYEDIPLETSDRRRIEVEFISNVYEVDHKKVVECNIRNITEHKRQLESQHALLIALINSPHDILIFSLDKNYCYTTFNKKHSEEMKRVWNADIKIGMNLLDCMQMPELRELAKQSIDRALRGEVFSEIQHQLDQNIYYEFSWNPIRQGNEIVGVTSFIRDVTGRKRAEEALRQSEERFRRLVKSVTDYIYTVKLESGRPVATFHGPACVTVTGYTAEEYTSDPALWYRMIYEEDKQVVKDHAAKVLSEAEVLPIEHRIVHKNGSIRWIRNTPALQRNDQGVLVAYDGLISDITERKKMEDGLRQMQKLEGLGTLAGGIAHDFNNILGIILAYISSIKRFKDDTKNLDFATVTITKAVERGETLVQQILTFARKTETAFRAVNVNDVVMEIVNMIYEMFPKTVTCSQNLDKEIPYINADHSQLSQILLNLCVNARDAMPKGGVLTINTRMVSVTNLRAQHPDADVSSYVCIEVSDTGEGITEETQKRIFEPFFTTKVVGKGTGLGLAVVFGVVQTHKGFIDVESELGKGTTFRLYLPASQATEPVYVKEKEETVEKIPGGTETLLVVEDEEMLLMSLQMVLVEKGYKVISTKDGLKALKIYQEKKNDIDLVLTDLGLPNMTGLEVCRRIKTINPNEHIILATGYLDPDMKSEFLKVGVQHFLYKPYDLRKVLKVIREVLDEK